MNYIVFPLCFSRSFGVGIRAYLLLVSTALCWAIPSATAQRTVKRLAAERFVFNIGESGDLAVPIDWNHDPGKPDASIEHLVLATPGYGRYNGYDKLFSSMLTHIPSRDKVAYYMLQFLTSQDIRHHGLDDRHPYWTDGGWVIGDQSLSGSELPRATRVSSFAVVDELLRRALGSFPNLKTVVVGGFSAGGQFTNRYLAAGRMHGVLESHGIEVRYIVGAPSSYLYFCENRLVGHNPSYFGPVTETEYADCEGFNTYRYGFEDMNPYMAAVGPETLASNYSARRVDYITGADDDERASADLMTGCGAMLQGSHRRERMEVYQSYLAFRFGGDVLERHRLYIIPGAGHNIPHVFDNPIGEELLFGEVLNRTADRGVDSSLTAIMQEHRPVYTPVYTVTHDGIY